MSLMTLVYLLAAVIVVGAGIGVLAEMDAGEIAAQVGLMAGAALSMYGLVALLA